MASRKYHSLISRTPNEKWALEFGDYSKDVVLAERDDMKTSADKGTQFRVITTGDKQAEISAAVEKLNEEIK